MKRVLIVGAGGFAGGFIVEEALRRGYEVYAGVRESTSRKYLTDSCIKFVVFDFENPSTLADTLVAALPEGQRWDYIVYNLGATKCLNFMMFSKINYGYLRDFTEALKKTDLVPEKLLFISSLSAVGPGDEKGYSPFTEEKIPTPNTRYGASKLKAEMWLAESGIPHIIFRATGLYGPRDRDYFLMFKSISKGFDFSVGYRKQLLSFLYVEDLARAVFDALQDAPTGETYNIAETRSYTQKEFRKLSAEALKKRLVLPICMPLWAVKAVSAIAEKWGVARMRPSTLNRDKYNIMKQRNWAVDTGKARRDFGFEAKVSLEEGIKRAVAWYRKEGWL
ncbi:MAG: NAD(P)-dependent oxidoreductase [Prevotella sp.]|nr:NAD(P)-dependent oxidoreductase [Bacteroides sp.]MCM1365710.1 NAD(P)-dependent oxidoreductase [Prevotella sp.]MCM1436380.1 NAD(P)-dependent oxidoreductase [Prevotella sp.]